MSFDEKKENENEKPNSVKKINKYNQYKNIIIKLNKFKDIEHFKIKVHKEDNNNINSFQDKKHKTNKNLFKKKERINQGNNFIDNVKSKKK